MFMEQPLRMNHVNPRRPEGRIVGKIPREDISDDRKREIPEALTPEPQSDKESVAYKIGVWAGKLKDGGRSMVESFMERRDRIKNKREEVMRARALMEEASRGGATGREGGNNKEEIDRRYQELKRLTAELAEITGGPIPEAREGTEDKQQIEEIKTKLLEITTKIHNRTWMPEDAELKRTASEYLEWVNMKIVWARLKQFPDLVSELSEIKAELEEIMPTDEEKDLQPTKEGIELEDMREKPKKEDSLPIGNKERIKQIEAESVALTRKIYDLEEEFKTAKNSKERSRIKKDIKELVSKRDALKKERIRIQGGERKKPDVPVEPLKEKSEAKKEKAEQILNELLKDYPDVVLDEATRETLIDLLSQLEDEQ